jgi:hypothetical protein
LTKLGDGALSTLATLGWKKMQETKQTLDELVS